MLVPSKHRFAGRARISGSTEKNFSALVIPGSSQPLSKRGLVDMYELYRLPRLPGAKCVRLKLWAKLEVPPWSPERNACVVYVCGSIEKFSGLGEKALQQGE
jgi:hypothetical protein